MRPLSLTIENIGSWRGRHELNLSAMPLAVFSGRTGAGKSTLAYDAIRFAVFGETRLGLDSIVSQGEEEGVVEFRFELNGQELIIVRRRSKRGNGKSILSFRRNGKPLDGANARETQARIEQITHLTPELFAQTVFCGQGDAALFSQATRADRSRIFGEILVLGPWEDGAHFYRQAVADHGSRVTTLEERREELQHTADEVEGLNAELTALDADIKAAEGVVDQATRERREAQGKREKIVREQEADRQKREGLTALDETAKARSKDLWEVRHRLGNLRQAVQGKDDLTDALAKAEKAQAHVEAMDTLHRQDEQLLHEQELLEQKAAAAAREQGQKIEAFEGKIAQARAAQTRLIDDAQRHLTSLTAQTEVLKDVPCLHDDAQSPMAEGRPDLFDSCPLAEIARTAQAMVPTATETLRLAREGTPWAEDETALKTLKEQKAGAQHEDALEHLEKPREALGYDLQAHEKARKGAKRLPDLRNAVSAAEKAETQLAEVQGQEPKAQAALEAAITKRDALKAELGEAPDFRHMLQGVDAEVAGHDGTIRAQQSQVQTLGQQRGGKEEQLRVAEQAGEKAKTVADEAKVLRHQLTVEKLLVRACSKDGIPALLVEKAVPELEAEANRAMEILWEGELSIALATQRDTKAGGIAEALDIVVHTPRGTQPYEWCSGGEKKSVDLALRLGLGGVIANRAGQPCRFRVFDEVTENLDKELMAAFLRYVAKTASDYDCTVVISHRDEIKDAFPKRVQVTKDAEGSRFEVVET